MQESSDEDDEDDDEEEAVPNGTMACWDRGVDKDPLPTNHRWEMWSKISMEDKVS